MTAVKNPDLNTMTKAELTEHKAKSHEALAQCARAISSLQEQVRRIDKMLIVIEALIERKELKELN